jgi:signal transduction histidine kinase
MAISEESTATESLDRPGSLLMQAPTPICVTRGAGHRVEIMNPAFEAMAGVRGGVGRPFGEIAADFDVASQLDVMERALRRGERVTAAEVVMRSLPAGEANGAHATGERFFTLVYEPLHDRTGAVDGLMISGVEVTAHVAGRRDREAAEQRARFLVDASAALAESLDYAQTLRRVAELAVPRIADWCTVSAIDERGSLRRLAVVHWDPTVRPLVEEYERSFPPSQHRAGELSAALVSDRAILRDRVSDADLVQASQSPEHLRVMRGLGCASCIIAPMVARGEPVGVVSFMRSDADHPYTPRDVATAEELAYRAALAIDNARLYRAARRREETMRFFAEASAVLSSSLDYEAAFDKLAQLVVPTFADWCAVEVKEDNHLRLVAVAHANPAKIELARELRRRYPPDEQAASGAAQVIRSGQAELYAEISDEMLARSARDDEHLRAARDLGLRSAVVVPLVGRGAPLGALTLVWAESDHRYGDDDLRVMEELGRRAGYALENARLYGETQSAVRLRDEFISIASHELKTPLTSMQLQISGIRRAAASPARLDVGKLARRVDAIDKQVGRLTELVDGLLDVSRAAAGRLRLNFEDIDLAEVVRVVAERFAAELGAARSELDLEVPASILGRWDRLRLDDIVTNLLGNAVKYGAGRPIRLAARLDGDVAVIEVRDHGIGIPPGDQQRIFERFARAVSSEHYGGFGLGLWIVHVLVQAMGGSVEVESVVGEGALFTVKLPRNSQKHGSNHL